jgi:hypothetical protein
MIKALFQFVVVNEKGQEFPTTWGIESDNPETIALELNKTAREYHEKLISRGVVNSFSREATSYLKVSTLFSILT